MGKGFSRRDFVKTFVVTAGAVVAAPLLDACGSDPVSTPDAAAHPDANQTPDAPPASFFPQSVASGDPRTDSIMIWTRFAGATSADQELTVELATDMAFTSRVTVTPSTVTALATADGSVRVKVVGLTAGTRYYYRFRSASPAAVTNTGRFKTAAADSDETQVRFSLLSCQDYIGKFYNTLTELLDPAQDDLAFVLFIGDYVYETTGDPTFQATNGRAVSFTDLAGAIKLGTDAAPFYAAKSVSNYRELYKTYRSDKTLQRVHELFPFLVIWDDHEFSDDCWQDVGTYTDGVQDETDAVRRVNSEQVFFEYQPVNLDSETGSGALALTRDDLWPHTKLYRDFRFGKHVHILLTDYRSFRPDHPIPEEGSPGTIVMDETALMATLTAAGSNAAPSSFAPYVDLDSETYAAQKAAAMVTLQAKYVAAGATVARATLLTTAATSGNVDANYLNSLWTDAQKATLTIATGGLPFGMSLQLMGKTGLFGQLGARYLVVKPTYDLYALYRSTQAATPDDPYGATQSTWLAGRLAAFPDATWKFLIDSVSMTSLIIDLTGLPVPIPATTYYLNCDQWDGFPVHRAALFEQLRPHNVVVLSGDIHAAYATDYGADGSGNRMVEFTCPGVSSGPFSQLLRSTANSVPALMGNPLVETLIAAVDGLNQGAFPALKYANSNVNGVVILTAAADQLVATFALLDPVEVTTDSTADATLKNRFKRGTGTVPKTAGKNGAMVVVKPPT